MEIVLQNNLILIRTDFNTLNQEWIRSFLIEHSKNMLFLPRAVLVFQNQSLVESRKEFLEELGSYHAKKHDLSQEFFKRSLLKLKNKPIKIELLSMQDIQAVSVELYARDRYTVDISLFYPNSWVMSFLIGQFGIYVLNTTDSSISLDVSDSRSRTMLERVLNKKNVLHYEIQYSYDSDFLRRLYNGFSMFDYDEHSDENIDQMIHFYNVLECPVGASLDTIKKNYKKLVRVYHPDRIFHTSPTMLDHYTEKFQLLQEAYSALKIVS
ncbi:DnaJ domain-containing protein [Sulfurimonas sp. HSL-1716]|uniref:J domain-containing protein n=1 Tax=Hydrocurvibacter sulfurireducens TaxID=3131937 RepID=UPI0031F74E03